MTLLEIESLDVAYRTRGTDTTVLHDVSLSVAAGEVVAIVGESGSGKSTTAQSIIGLLAENGRRERGAIRLNGTDVAGWSAKRLRAIRGTQIGFVPQDPGSSLDPVLTIGAQIEEVFRVHRRGTGIDRRRRVIELLERVGIPDPEQRAKQFPHELSGGMRQRVLIAIAVALDPQLIIADEPTSALDVTVQRRILDLIDVLRRESGSGVLLVTHDLSVAAERSDRIVVMRASRVVEQGSTSQVLASPQDEYTRRLLSDAPALRPIAFRAPPAVPAGRPAIRVSGLVKEFALGRTSVRAVDDVSFDVARGTTHSLVGESGSGKTTTARLVVGLTTPTSGAVTIDGTDVAGLDRDGRRRLRRTVQLVYQNPFASLDPLQDVRDIIAEPLVNFRIGDRRTRAARAAELIDQVALPASVLGRKPRELSGGQRQRVAIARALALDPEILVLDEAVSALDVTVQAQILDLLDRLQRELHLTYLFISHDLSVVRQISDTVSVMHRGQIVASGTTREIFTAADDEYTRTLLAAVPLAHETPTEVSA